MRKKVMKSINRSFGWEMFGIFAGKMKMVAGCFFVDQLIVSARSAVMILSWIETNWMTKMLNIARARFTSGSQLACRYANFFKHSVTWCSLCVGVLPSMCVRVPPLSEEAAYYLSRCNEPGLVLGRLSCRGNFVTLDLFYWVICVDGERERESWRAKGRQASGGRRGGGAAQVVRGDWRDEWQWKVIERGRENNSWGSRREEKWDDSAFIFLLSYFPLSPSPSLTHPSISVLHSAASQAGLAESPHFSLLTPSTLKVISTNLAVQNARISNLFMWLLPAVIGGGCSCVCTCTIRLFFMCTVHELLEILDASPPHTY